MLSYTIISFLLPLIITIPLYILGRKLFFKNTSQDEMHLSFWGKLFTIIIGIVQIILTTILYMFFY